MGSRHNSGRCADLGTAPLLLRAEPFQPGSLLWGHLLGPTIFLGPNHKEKGIGVAGKELTHRLKLCVNTCLDL